MNCKKCFLLFLMVVCLLGCEEREASFPFLQPSENIVKIELLAEEISWDGIEAIYTLEPVLEVPAEEYNEFIEGFMELECSRGFGDFPTDFGSLAIRITYQNGDYEIIGQINNAYFTSTKNHYDSYYFDFEEFYDFFSEYVDASHLPNKK